MTTLIIAEKPSASEKIANALAEDEIKKIKDNDSVYYKIKRNGEEIFIVPAVGHLFGLKQKGKGSDYPRFDVVWKPTFKISKKSAYAEKYYENMKKVAENCDDFIVACDYDQEGSVIGYNILRFICGRENCKRMKFSTLTKEELEESYKNALPSLDFGMINSGLCRHELDWYYGINLSRALTKAIKKYGKVFGIISTGRVQGPMLAFLAKREKEIQAFKPTPFWQLILKFKIKNKTFEAMYEEKQIWDENKADRILKESQIDKAIIVEIKKTRTSKKPPAPFNLTSLQTEAYNLFGYSPKQTSDIAQSLYSNAYISYPRTSSQKLPKQLNLKKILEKLAKQSEYETFVEKIFQLPELKPTEGKKTDPAHPAIHPTGEIPGPLRGPEKKIYDLIVRRFLACFGTPAIRESMKIVLDANKNKFKITGSRTIEKNWIEFYGPYAKFQEISLPNLNKGDMVKIMNIVKIDKETQPPNRYSQGSILKELEKRSIGTKATRANILQTLYDRNFVYDKSIHVTDLGMSLVEALEKYVPDILSEKLTRKFENEMNLIFENKKEKEKVLIEAQKVLIKTMIEFKKNEEEIGKLLDEGLIKTREKQNTLGICPNCGNKLKIMFSPRTKKRFVGCEGYKKEVHCTTGYPIPLKGKIVSTGKVCDKCGTPIIYCYRKGMRPFKMCLDPNCPTKKDWKKKEDEIKEDEEIQKIEKDNN